MADEQITILIKAVDEMSAVVKKIEGNIEDLNSKTLKQNETTTQSFQNQVRTLLVLGNVASSVDRIFSSYQNLQLRLENATERVTSAQERLISAQEKLLDVQRSAQRLAIDLEKLSIKERDSKKKLTKLNETLADMIRRHVLPSSKRYKETLQEIQDEELNLKEIKLDSKQAQEKNAQDIVTAKRQIEMSTRSLTIAENNLERANNQVIGTYINMGTSALSAVSSLAQLGNVATTATGSMGGLMGIIGIGGLGATLGVAGAMVGLLYVLAKYSEDKTFTETTKQHVADLELLKQKASETEKAFIDLIIQTQKLEDIQAKAGLRQTIQDQGKKFDVGSNFKVGGTTNPQSVFKVQQDFISRPGQAPIPFSSSDTLFATKNPGGMGGNIYISIDSIYGMNPRDISIALKKELGTKISI